MRLPLLLVVSAALPAAAADVTRHRINTFTPAGIQAPATRDFTSPANTNFNLVRPFSTSGANYTALINGHSGRLQISSTGTGATFGATVVDTTNPGYRCSNAAVIPFGSGALLALHDPFAGTVRLLGITQAGTLSGSGNLVQRESLKDKNLFDAYQRAGSWYFFALDTFSGAAASYTDNGSELATETWSLGYSTVDHLTVGADTYRLIYKAVGDPTLRASEAGDNTGMLVIQRVGADGMNQANSQVITIGAEYSHLRFVTIPGSPTTYRVLAYDRESGASSHAAFNPAAGTVTLPFSAPVATLDKWADVEPVVAGGAARINFLADDGVEPFHVDEAERMAIAIHDRLKTRVAGYQLVLMQSGRIIARRAWGYTRLGASPVPMTTRTRMDVGSVSKMVMATSMLELSRRGIVDLDGPLRASVGYAGASSWLDSMSLSNAMSHTTGMSAGGCDGNPDSLTMNCAPFYAADRNPALLDVMPGEGPRNDYMRDYNNSGIALARDVFRTHRNASTSPQVTQDVFDLWATNARFDVDQFSCQHRPDVNYFGACRGAAGCVGSGNDSYQQSMIIADWSNNCSAGGWSISSRQLSEYLTAVRYRKLMFGAAPEQLRLIDTTMQSGNQRTAFGWDAPVSYAGELTLGKGGSNHDEDSTARFNAHIRRFPSNVDAVLLVNTAGVNTGTLLGDGYLLGLNASAAVGNEVIEDTYDVGGSVDRLAVNEWSQDSVNPGAGYVTALRNGAGQLRLDAFDVNGGLQLVHRDDVIDEPMISVAMTDGSQFATAIRSATNQLRLRWWSYSGGALTRHGVYTGPTIDDVDVTRVGTPSLGVHRVAAVAQRPNGQLTLEVVDHSGNVTSLRSSSVIATGTGAAVQTLVRATTGTPTGRLVLAFRNALGALELQTWDINPLGGATLRHALTRSTVTTAQSAKRIAIDQRGNFSTFFTQGGFVSMHIKPDGNAEHRSWSVAANGAMTERDTRAGSSSTSVDAMRGITVQRRDTTNVTLKRWEVANDGTFDLVDWGTFGAVNQVLTAGGRLMPYRDVDNLMRVSTFSFAPHP